MVKIAAGAALLALTMGSASAATIKLSSPEWLGSLGLEKKQLDKIADAAEKALTAPVDAEQQCGAVRQDCEVRAAREWEFNGNKYREIVIYIHTKGHAMRTVKQQNGKWPSFAAN